MNESVALPSYETGTVIAGKYRIDRTLAEGGMGFVVAATHVHLDQPVALKFLRDEMSFDLDALARFTREAKAAAQLRSEHVARVLDAGVTGEGMPYMAMEYLEGESLADALQRLGPFDVGVAVEFVIQACEGLGEAHARGIVHRDIKPYNLFAVERAPGWRAVKILDFGISKVSFPRASNVVTGVVIGSPCYMSPEQLRAPRTIDHRTDIWSLGATLYELLAGFAAFDASLSLPEIIASILEGPVPSVRASRPDIPEALAAIVSRCLSKDRADRFATTGELAMALLPFAPHRAHVPAERAASFEPSSRPPSSATEAPRDAMAPTTSHRFVIDERILQTPAPVAFALGPPGAAGPKRDGRKSTAPIAVTVPPPEERLDSLGLQRGPLSARRGWLVPIAAAAATAAVVSAFGPWRSAARDRPTVAAAAAIASGPSALDDAPVTRLAQPPPEPEPVELVVRVSPSYARLSVDDVTVGNPFRASYPKNGRIHHVLAQAWGFDSKSEDISVSADTIVELSLERRAAGAPPAATTASAVEVRSVQETGAGVRGSSSAPLAVSGAPDVDSSGGRAPLRPIERNDPYGAK